jgi:hypothetical protein
MSWKRPVSSDSDGTPSRPFGALPGEFEAGSGPVGAGDVFPEQPFELEIVQFRPFALVDQVTELLVCHFHRPLVQGAILYVM